MQILQSLKTEFITDKTDQTDGLKIFRENSWGLVRASGTEPIIRIIVDADNEKNGNALFQEIHSRVLKSGQI